MKAQQAAQPENKDNKDTKKEYDEYFNNLSKMPDLKRNLERLDYGMATGLNPFEGREAKASREAIQAEIRKQLISPLLIPSTNLLNM